MVMRLTTEFDKWIFARTIKKLVKKKVRKKFNTDILMKDFMINELDVTSDAKNMTTVTLKFTVDKDTIDKLTELI